MHISKMLLCGSLVILLVAGSVAAMSVSMKISGPGAVGENTIKAGQKVSVDIYVENDTTYTGFTMGFKITSPDIKTVKHAGNGDSSLALNEAGDIKGYNGWQDQSVWDLKGIFVVEWNWDGVLPDTLGFGGLCVKQRYTKHELEKKLSFDLVVPEAGTLIIDSSFYPPGGKWLFSAPARIAPTVSPEWGGPYKYKVVK